LFPWAIALRLYLILPDPPENSTMWNYPMFSPKVVLVLVLAVFYPTVANLYWFSLIWTAIEMVAQKPVKIVKMIDENFITLGMPFDGYFHVQHVIQFVATHFCPRRFCECCIPDPEGDEIVGRTANEVGGDGSGKIFASEA